MPTVRQVERQIKAQEGFDVRFLHLDGRDVRGDLDRIPAYRGRYQRMAFNAASVTDWIENRFRPHYPGFGVAVLKADGSTAHGNYRLSTVRDSYLGP